MAEIIGPLVVSIIVANVVVFTPLAFVAAEILERPNKPALVLGLLMGPVGLILIGFLEPKSVTRCPACHGSIRWHGATKCRHCGSPLPTTQTAP